VAWSTTIFEKLPLLNANGGRPSPRNRCAGRERICQAPAYSNWRGQIGMPDDGRKIPRVQAARTARRLVRIDQGGRGQEMSLLPKGGVGESGYPPI
jgi:hypothetical protein